MKKITELTKEQLDSIPRYIEDCINQANIATDKPKAESSIKAIYKSMNKKEPFIIWGQSPMQAALFAGLYKRGDQLHTQLCAQLSDRIKDQLNDRLCAQLSDRLCAQLSDRINDQLNDQLSDQLSDRLCAQLSDQLYTQFRGVWSNTYMNIWWRRWSYMYLFAQGIGVKFREGLLDIFCNILNEVDCIIPYDGIVFLSEKPTSIHWQDGKLHCDAGTAVQYKDGYSLYSITGVHVDRQIVLNPKSLTIEQIQNEENQEKRRIMIERFGASEYLEAINAKLIDVDMRGVHGAGPRALMEEPNGNQWLVATDGSTNRVYHLLVGEGNKTCRQAHELLCGFSEDLIKAEG